MTDLPGRAVHNIGVVARRTGLKPDLIRAWERRYEAVEPERSDADLRLYSDADVERLALLRDAVRLGHRIGHIARLSDDELRELVPARQPPARAVAEAADPEVAPSLDACLAAIRELDGERLRSLLDRASFDLGRIALVERLLVPLMTRVGALWLEGEIDPAHEHLASAKVRDLLGTYVGAPAPAGAAAIVVATPAGQRHELGAILAAATAAASGWRVVYLGADLPAGSIVRGARAAGAAVVALGITYPDAEPGVQGEFGEIARGLAPATVLVAGGRGAERIGPQAAGLGIRVVNDLGDFRRLLGTLAPPPHD
jgi:MerR family transcriptional regulator, light-induced transcriptional regulator